MLVETGYADVDGGRLYYETSGKGPALVLIHAGFLDSRMWDIQFQLFSENYRVIRYDVRGFGKSDVAQTKFSDYKDLRRILDHLEAKTASLVGVSNGGRIASDFAVEYPSMVDHLVLVSPGMSGYKFSGPEEEKLWEEFDKQMKPQEEADREGRAADAVEMDVTAWAPAQTLANRERITQIAMDNFHVHVENPWKLQVPPEPRTWERLSNIRVPTLLIIGDRDVPAQILMVDNIHTHIPGSKKVLIQGGDHIVNMSKPDEFNRTVLEFLRTQTQEIQA
ncbi:alpha/beta hydrolase [Candidatus Bathyarchaeota archaeon]|nr:MAG: alpha/beta hydrolase [Candidatus Bathyarchaeota archaeon]